MKLTFGGVRGSRPVTDPAFAGYGGDTTSVLVVGAAGERILVDAGSGLANLEPYLGGQGDPLLLVFSHYHLDHLLGLPMFAALRHEGRRIAVAGPRGLERALGGLVAPPYWPLPLEDVPARLEYPDLTDRRLTHGGLAIAFCPVAHPGGCFAYRIQEDATGTALVFATDIEWAAMDQAQRTLFLDMCRRPFPAQLLVMDGHLTLNDSAVRKGWGHSTFAEVIQAARLIGDPKVILTHHDPAHDDRELDAFAMSLHDHVDNHAPGLQASLARQGQVLEVQA